MHEVATHKTRGTFRPERIAAPSMEGEAMIVRFRPAVPWNGTKSARLGWLIDPLEKQVFVYRPDAPVEHLQDPVTLSGEPVLAGFTSDLARVW